MTKFNVKDFKVTYYKPGQPNILCAEFFDQFEDALSYSKGLSGSFLIMRKHIISGGSASWELMPYGSYSDYRTGIQLMEYKWYILGMIFLVIYVAVKMKSSSSSVASS